MSNAEFPVLHYQQADEEYAFNAMYAALEGVPICPATGEAGAQEADPYVQAVTICLSGMGMADEVIAEAYTAAVQRRQYDKALEQEFSRE